MNYCEIYKTDLCRGLQTVGQLRELNGASVLVTGAGGLIGSAVTDMLVAANDSFGTGMTVYAAGRSMEKLRERFAFYAERDDFRILPYNAEEMPDWGTDFNYIIHTASPAYPAAYSRIPVETMLTNITGTGNLLSYAKTHGVRRFLYISSSEVYGRRDGAGPHHEEEYGFVDILNSRSCYPSAKRAAETLCAAFRAEYGVDFAIARPGHVYGPTASPDDNRVASEFLRDAAEGRELVLKSAGTQLRSYCYVVDCASAILSILISGGSGEAYNIANRGSVVTIREFAELVAACSVSRVVFAEPTDAERKSFNPMDDSSLNPEKIEALGWQGLFDVETGIRHSIEILRFPEKRNDV